MKVIWNIALPSFGAALAIVAAFGWVLNLVKLGGAGTVETAGRVLAAVLWPLGCIAGFIGT